MPPKVLICPKVLDHTAGEHFDVLVQAGFSVRYAKPVRDLMTAEELCGNLNNIDAVIAGSEPYTAQVLAKFPQIRVISRVGVGYDSVDVEAATRQGTAVCITPGTNHDSVAELTLMFLLAIAKRVIPSHAMIVAGGFDRKMTRPLRGQTLGLVGYGRIGRTVAKHAIGLGMNVLAYDPFLTAGTEEGVTVSSLDDVIAHSDFISLHAPLTPETRHIIRRETIARMKQGVVLVNTARGPLIDEAALAEALTNGQVSAAGLDVFEKEPPLPGSPILSAPNVVFTPHVGGIDEEGVRQMAVMACKSVVDLFQGRWPAERIVNAEALPDWRWSMEPAST